MYLSVTTPLTAQLLTSAHRSFWFKEFAKSTLFNSFYIIYTVEDFTIYMIGDIAVRPARSITCTHVHILADHVTMSPIR